MSKLLIALAILVVTLVFGTGEALAQTSRKPARVAYVGLFSQWGVLPRSGDCGTSGSCFRSSTSTHLYWSTRVKCGALAKTVSV